MTDGATGAGTAALLAVFLVPFVSLIKRPTWGTKANYAVAMAAALVCAIAGAAVDGQVTSWSTLIANLGVALGTSQTIYMLYFADTNAETVLAAK